MPAVFYGKKEASTPIALSQGEFLKIWQKAGESSVINLTGDGFDVDALIYDVDRDPVTGVPRHADFYVFEKGQKIEVSVPLEFVGVSPAVKELGALLVKVLYEIKIEAEPKNLPHKIEVDIASLATLESQILAKDVKMPEGVTLKEKPEEVVAAVAMAKEEPIEETPVDLSAIEVEKKGKKEEEGAEGAAEAPAKEGADK